MSAIDLRASVREIPDFPKPGILFRDITPLMRHAAAWQEVMRQLGDVCDRLQPDLIVGIESRGFIVGTALAIGMATAAATGPIAIARLGRDGAARLGLVVIACALAAIALVPTLIGGVAAYGVILVLLWLGATGGGTMVNASTARLSDKHREDSARVITEANAAAAGSMNFAIHYLDD